MTKWCEDRRDSTGPLFRVKLLFRPDKLRKETTITFEYTLAMLEKTSEFKCGVDMITQCGTTL
jgi:hypothetical protein